VISLWLKAVSSVVGQFGLDVHRLSKSVKGLPWFLHDLSLFRKQLRQGQADFVVTRYYPCLTEKQSEIGSTKGHYFQQDLMVARKVYAANPSAHLDVGSRMDGFISHLAVFRHVVVGDIRPMTSNIPNVSFTQLDLMADIGADMIGRWPSISCLHALEHFGLGRYGDPIRADGHLLGLRNLAKMLEGKGRLYLSVPIGRQRVEFNAHRVFAVGYLLKLFDSYGLKVDVFSYIDDEGSLHESADDMNVPENLNFGCGIFELTKIN
jgi:hypothetical protein